MEKEKSSLKHELDDLHSQMETTTKGKVGGTGDTNLEI